MPFIQVNDRQMHYIDRGEGFALLLGHSYMFDSNMWAPQIEALSQHFRVIAPDLWGHGKSDQLPESRRSLKDLASDHLALMDALDINEFAVVGLSVGGMWGVELAAMVPDRVRALVLMDTFVGLEPEVTFKKYDAMLNAIDAAGKVPAVLVEQIVPMFFRRETEPHLLEALTEHLSNLPESVLRQSIVPLGRMIFGRGDSCPLLEELKMPALVITGEQDAPRPPLEGYLMAEMLNCKQLVVPQAGHICTLEQPEWVNEALLNFLMSIK
ncbi:alpha/beta fold hydrolase [Hafnia alvei]|uniref:alpha/beta fold hydrolase n=1 Tax=Hafnia alvei TaxID=569 RepID=UPI001034DCA7|nr:alpha/beta fold hydrolase [Hafnia alvei]TBL82407.1 alpha/beta fold hydrolase [Hafnia alvei]